MKRLWLMLALVAASLLAWELKRLFFPSDQSRIRKELTELAKTASFSPQEGNFARIWKAQKLAAFFSTNASVEIEFDGRKIDTLASREELQEAVLAARSRLRETKFQLLDITVHVDAAKAEASAEMTLLGDMDGERAALVEELEMKFEKEGRNWMIREVRGRKPGGPVSR